MKYYNLARSHGLSHGFSYMLFTWFDFFSINHGSVENGCFFFERQRLLETSPIFQWNHDVIGSNGYISFPTVVISPDLIQTSDSCEQ